jgi:hypothetical protein
MPTHSAGWAEKCGVGFELYPLVVPEDTENQIKNAALKRRRKPFKIKKVERPALVDDFRTFRNLNDPNFGEPKVAGSNPAPQPSEFAIDSLLGLVIR